ncbi:MAG: glycosyltransferase family 4 protein [Elusimicrobia bacterium]|nr:glycosyltransferase family 4 protein [Elusimicrobiota bacterium]
MQGKIRVLHLITKLEFGGAQQNTLYTVGHLNREGFDVHLVCGVGGYLDKEALLLPKGIQIHWLRFMKRQIRPWWDLLALFELIVYLRRIRPDIIHTHSSKAGILGRWAAKLAGVPVVIHTFHGFGFHDFQKPLTRSLLAFSERITGKITTQFVFVSKSNEEYAKRWNITAKEPPVLIRSGVALKSLDQLSADHRNKKRKELNLSTDALVVATVGNLKAQKNPEHYIELARRFKNHASLPVFLFIGGWEGGGARETIFQQAPPNLKYLGWREDVREILNASDIFVMTSLWEGLPRSSVEALRLGLPVLAYAADGLREVIQNGKNGFLLTSGDLDAMERRLKAVLEDAGQRKSLSTAAKAAINEDFDIDAMVRRQEKLYSSLFSPITTRL